MIYFFDYQEQLDDIFLNKLAEILPQDRVAKANKYRQPIDRDLCIISFALLQYGLMKKYGYLSSLKMRFNSYGKPFLCDSNTYFNISHCNHGVACGLSNNEIGVDIQNYVETNEDFIQHFCSTDELKWLNYSRNVIRDITLLWTRKESYLKKIGTGITDDLKDLSYPYMSNQIEYKGTIFTSLIKSNYIITTCSDITEQFVKVTLRELSEWIDQCIWGEKYNGVI